MPDEKNKNASFSGGLVLGLALGSTLSYFSTADGKKTWQKLSKEWDQARAWLYEKALIEDETISLEEFKTNFILKMKQSVLGAKDSLELLKLNFEQAKNQEKARKKRSRSRQKSKFKGI